MQTHERCEVFVTAANTMSSMLQNWTTSVETQADWVGVETDEAPTFIILYVQNHQPWSYLSKLWANYTLQRYWHRKSNWDRTSLEQAIKPWAGYRTETYISLKAQQHAYIAEVNQDHGSEKHSSIYMRRRRSSDSGIKSRRRCLLTGKRISETKLLATNDMQHANFCKC